MVVTSGSDSVTVRRASADDLPFIIDVCGTALQWSDLDTDQAFFRWKHLDNPWGPSPIWVAVDGQGGGPDDPAPIVGVRTMMRWGLEAPLEVPHEAVRAVDTATLPSHQGRGIFSRTTMAAVEALTDDGVSAVFNTPNDKSRPGYLKMGWHQVGRVPIAVQPRTPATLLAMLRSKVAAEKWGMATDVGLDPAQALSDTRAVTAAIEGSPARSGWATLMSLDYLRWRTAFKPLGARIAPLGRSIDDGFVVFRLRRRGRLVQLSILHAVGPAGGRDRRRAVRRLLRETGADVVMVAGSTLGWADGLVPLPKAGPILTWRPLARDGVPARSDLDLELGAIELF